MQHFGLIAFFAVVALASANNDLFVGIRERGDELVEVKQVDKSYLPLVVVTKDLTIPDNGIRSYNITRIEVIDRKKKDTSATVAITSGGPGHHHATLSFKSVRGHGIHFLVRVFGIKQQV